MRERRWPGLGHLRCFFGEAFLQELFSEILCIQLRSGWQCPQWSHILKVRRKATARPFRRPFRTNSLGRVTRHWRVWLISEVASRQVPVAHDKGRGPLLAGHDGCPTGIDKVVAGALTKKRRRRLARKRSHVLKGQWKQPPVLSIVPSGRIHWVVLPDTGVSG